MPLGVAPETTGKAAIVGWDVEAWWLVPLGRQAAGRFSGNKIDVSQAGVLTAMFMCR